MTAVSPSTHPGWGPLRKALVTAEHFRRLKNGCFWFLAYLVASVNHRTGKFVTTWAAIAAETGLAEAHLRSMAGHLRAKGYVSLSPVGPDSIKFTLRGWLPIVLPHVVLDGRTLDEARGRGARPARRRRRTELPPLAREVAAVLGVESDTDLATITDLVATHSERLVRRALEAALSVPENKIRASRFALFRHIVTRQDGEDDTSPSSSWQ